MFKKKPSRKIITRRKPVKQKQSSRLLEFAIVAIAALVVIYAISFTVRITRGFSKTVETPEFTIRMQILNGCGIDGAARQAEKNVPGQIRLPLDLMILEVTDFDSYHVKESFIISRDKDTKPAKLLADQLDLDKDKIIYKPLENNYQSINIALVLGEDYLDIWKDKNKGD